MILGTADQAHGKRLIRRIKDWPIRRKPLADQAQKNVIFVNNSSSY